MHLITSFRAHDEIQDDRKGSDMVIPVSIGPIARTVEDCANFMKAVCVPALWEGDSTIPPMPFDTKAYMSEEKLNVGYFEEDGWFAPSKASRRALQETIQKLTKAGHTCKPFKPPTEGRLHYQL